MRDLVHIIVINIYPHHNSKSFLLLWITKWEFVYTVHVSPELNIQKHLSATCSSKHRRYKPIQIACYCCSARVNCLTLSGPTCTALKQQSLLHTTTAWFTERTKLVHKKKEKLGSRQWSGRKYYYVSNFFGANFTAKGWALEGNERGYRCCETEGWELSSFTPWTTKINADEWVKVFWVWDKCEGKWSRWETSTGNKEQKCDTLYQCSD